MTLISKWKKSLFVMVAVVAVALGGVSLGQVPAAHADPIVAQVTVKASAAKASNLHKGSNGPNVVVLQKLLDANKKKGNYFDYNGSYTKSFGSVTLAGLKKWEKDNHFKVDGNVTVGSAEWKKLQSTANKTRSVSTEKLDKRCLTGGLVACASKSSRKVFLIRDSTIIYTFSAKFGRPSLPTRNGTFAIFRISGADAVSSVYHVPMPYAMTFSGGQAMHYSPEFAKHGYSTSGSHGCINLRALDQTRRMNEKVNIGTKVVVYK